MKPKQFKKSPKRKTALAKGALLNAKLATEELSMVLSIRW